MWFNSKAGTRVVAGVVAICGQDDEFIYQENKEEKQEIHGYCEKSTIPLLLKLGKLFKCEKRKFVLSEAGGLCPSGYANLTSSDSCNSAIDLVDIK